MKEISQATVFLPGGGERLYLVGVEMMKRDEKLGTDIPLGVKVTRIKAKKNKVIIIFSNGQVVEFCGVTYAVEYLKNNSKK